MKELIYTIALSVGLICPLEAQTDPKLSNIEEYAFHGIKLGSPLSALLRIYPKASGGSPEKRGTYELETWRVSPSSAAPTGLGDASYATFSYCDGKLYQIELKYYHSTSKGIPDWRQLLPRLVDQFGEPEKEKYNNSEDTYFAWQTYGKLVWLTREEPARVTIEDSNTLRKIPPKKPASGF